MIGPAFVTCSQQGQDEQGLSAAKTGRRIPLRFLTVANVPHAG